MVVELVMSVKFWFVLAVILGIAEIVIPGGILINLALASVFVAAGLFLNLLDSWPITLTTWFISATILLFVVHVVVAKIFASRTRVDNTDEELDHFGKTVLVVETIGPGEKKGRVEFQGTTWSALGDGSVICAGSHAKIICKDNISLVVEATD